MKKCKMCGLIKPLDEFFNDKRLISKKGAVCKTCKRVREKKHRSNRIEKIKMERKKYYEKNREKELESNKNYIMDNKDKVDASRKKYYEKNKSTIDARLKKYQASLEGRLVMWRHNAKRRSIEWNLTIEQLKSIPMICHYTGEILTLERNKPNTISLDRVNNEQGYLPKNVVFCCSVINEMKMNRSVKDFVEWCSKVCSKAKINSYSDSSSPAIPAYLALASKL